MFYVECVDHVFGKWCYSPERSKILHIYAICVIVIYTFFLCMTYTKIFTNIFRDIGTLYGKFFFPWLWSKILIICIASFFTLAVGVFPALGIMSLLDFLELPQYKTFILHICLLGGLYLYVFVGLLEVNYNYQQRKQKSWKVEDVFGMLTFWRLLFFYICTCLVLIPFFLVHPFPEKGGDSLSISIAINYTITDLLLSSAVWCLLLFLLIRLLFMLCILVDVRNFAGITMRHALQKTLWLTKWKHLMLFVCFLVPFWIFFVWETLLVYFFAPLPYGDARYYLVLLHWICVSWISVTILTSIYNTLLQENGLIPLSQKDEVPLEKVSSSQVSKTQI